MYDIKEIIAKAKARSLAGDEVDAKHTAEMNAVKLMGEQENLDYAKKRNARDLQQQNDLYEIEKEKARNSQ